MGNYIKTHLGQSMPQAGKGLAIAVNGSGSLWSQGKLITSRITNHLITSSHATSDGINLYIPDARAGKFAKILTLSGTKTYTSVAPVLDLTGGGYAVVGDTYYLIGIAGKSQKLGLTYNFKTDTWTSLDTEIPNYLGSAIIPKDDTELYIYSGANRNDISVHQNILYKYNVASGALTQVDQFEGAIYNSAFNSGIYKDDKLYIEAYSGIFTYDLNSKLISISGVTTGINGTNYFVDGTTVYKGGPENQLEASLLKWSIDPLEVAELSKTPKSGCAVLVKDSGWLYSIPFAGEDSNLVYLDLSQHSWQVVFQDNQDTSYAHSDAYGPTVLEDTVISKNAQILKFSIDHTHHEGREDWYYDLEVSPNSASIQNHKYQESDYLESYELSVPENTTEQTREFIITGVLINHKTNIEAPGSKFNQKIIQLPY